MDTKTLQATRFWTLAQPVVSAYVTSVVRDFSARDDVLQDVAVAVIESFDRYDPERPFTAWALGIAQNHVRLYLRRERRERLVFSEETVAALANAFESHANMPALDHLPGCLEKLDARSRRLCDLRYVHDLKPAAIGQSLGMSANAVAKALQRVREQLRLCLERQSAMAGGTT